ncbi:MAG: DUF1893 domain-containing protein [Bacteroidales bacterium]|jgi:hypothetical protein|nr:DUF1893 domain-containing protein [Bacteroidales bacterium]
MQTSLVVERLKSNNLISCVIQNGDEIREFYKRGVADLFELTQNNPQFLKGASVADKVVGKGAAACMIFGGIRELFTYTISKPALEILHAAHISVHYEQCVDSIQNRTQTGICPVEQLTADTNDIPEIIELIRTFLHSKH